MDNKLKELLKRDYVILDGGMGTMLQAAGMKMGETPEMLNITQPELLISIHEKYLNAGSDIIYANTFGGNSYKLEECGHSVDELVTAGIKNARTACNNVKPEALVALTSKRSVIVSNTTRSAPAFSPAFTISAYIS